MSPESTAKSIPREAWPRGTHRAQQPLVHYLPRSWRSCSFAWPPQGHQSDLSKMQSHHATPLLKHLPSLPTVLRLKPSSLPQVLQGEAGHLPCVVSCPLILTPTQPCWTDTCCPPDMLSFHSSMPLPTLGPLPAKPFPTSSSQSPASTSSTFPSFSGSVSSIPWLHLWSCLGPLE